MRKSKPLEDNVLKTNCGCWIWLGFHDPEGYGSHSKWIGPGKRTKKIRAHRLFYENYKGLIPSDKLVCHSCDIPSCCNPAHLFLGTHKENTEDMDDKGRRANAPNTSWKTKERRAYYGQG